MILQKSTAFRPFARQFIVLAQIAFGTSDHDIVRRVAATARERDNVVDMVFLPHLAATVVAFALLYCILSVNIGARQFAVSLAFYGTLMLTLGTCLVRVIARPFSNTSAGLLGMFRRVFLVARSAFFDMCFAVIPIMLFFVFSIACAPGLTPFQVFLTMFCIFLLLSLAYLLRVIFDPLATIYAPFFLMTVPILARLSRHAVFTPAFQMRFGLFAWREELKGCKQPFAAFRAAFEWKRFINHLKFSFAGFAIRGGGQAAKQAFHPVNYAGLVHLTSIPHPERITNG